MMSYSNLHFKARLKWIEIEIEINQTVRARTLRNCTGLRYIRAIDPIKGGVACRFTIRIQEPRKWRDVYIQLQGFAESDFCVEKYEVVGIEANLEIYSKNGIKQELLTVLEDFYLLHSLAGSSDVQLRGIFDDTIQSQYAKTKLQRMVEQGRVISIGENQGICLQRIYLNDVDPDGRPLSLTDCSACIKITLRNERLPSSSFQAWERIAFETVFGHFFDFRKDEHYLKYSTNGDQLALNTQWVIDRNDPEISISSAMNELNHLYQQAHSSFKKLSAVWI